MQPGYARASTALAGAAILWKKPSLIQIGEDSPVVNFGIMHRMLTNFLRADLRTPVPDRLMKLHSGIQSGSRENDDGHSDGNNRCSDYDAPESQP